MSRRRSSLKGLTRRVFVHRLTFMGGGVILLGGACKDEPKPSAAPEAPKPNAAVGAPQTTSHKTFTNEEFLVLTAAVDRLLPKDEDPGAVEAGVPGYIDNALQAQQLQRMKDDFTSGINALNRRCTRMFKVDFVNATPAQQDEVLTAFKESPEKSGEYKWYDLLVTLSMEGFLGDPSYGGNKNKMGWKTMGFDLVGAEAAEVAPDYQGQKHLDHLRCGSGKGC